jgi:hypothetical protein
MVMNAFSRVTESRAYGFAFMSLVVLCLLFLPFGNADAPRNIFGGIAGLMGLLMFPRIPDRHVRWAMVFLLGYCLATSLWALDSVASLRDFLSQALMPAGLFVGTWVSLSGANGRTFRGRGALLLTLAMTISAIVLGLIGVAGVVGGPVNRYWPGVGQASTFAAYWFAFGLVIISSRVRGLYFHVLAGLLILSAIYIASVQLNRAVWLSFATAVGLSAIFPVLRVKTRFIRYGLAFLAVVIGSSTFYLAVSKIVMDRNGPNVPVVSGFFKMIHKDPRIRFWPYLVETDHRLLLFGGGFGQTNVKALNEAMPEVDAKKIPRTMRFHAHNLLLNYQKQIGITGILLCLGFGVCVLRSVTLSNHGGAEWMKIYPLITLAVVWFQKNFTDVWTLHGPQIAISILLGFGLAMTSLFDRPQDSDQSSPSY